MRPGSGQEGDGDTEVASVMVNPQAAVYVQERLSPPPTHPRTALSMRIALLFLALVPALLADGSEDTKVLRVHGWGTVRTRPDVAHFTLRVTASAGSAQEAEKLHRGKILVLLDALRKALPENVDMSEGHLAFVDGPRTMICTSLVEFCLPHMDSLPPEELGPRIAKILDTAAAAGAERSVALPGSAEDSSSSVHFLVSDTAAAHQKALEAAIADARARADAVSASTGVKVGRIHAIEEILARVSFPTPLRAEGIDSGEFESTVEVTLSLDLE